MCEYKRDQRALKLRNLSTTLYQNYLERQQGKLCEVVFQSRKKGVYTGVTGNYIDVFN